MGTAKRWGPGGFHVVSGDGLEGREWEPEQPDEPEVAIAPEGDDLAAPRYDEPDEPDLEWWADATVSDVVGWVGTNVDRAEVAWLHEQQNREPRVGVARAVLAAMRTAERSGVDVPTALADDEEAIAARAGG